MDAIGICLKGIEEVAGQEIATLLNVKPVAGETVIEFPVDRPEELARLCYLSQSLTRVLLKLGQGKVEKSLKDTEPILKKLVDRIDFRDWLNDRTFKVVVERKGEHDYSGQDIAMLAGELIVDRLQANVSVTDPDIIIFLYILGKDCWLGIDFSGFDMSKRQYRVFMHQSALNSTVGYALVRMAGEFKTLLDPFCGSGTIPIEAALFKAGMSPHFYRKEAFAFHRFMKIDLALFDSAEKTSGILASDQLLKYLKSTKSNAKLAGIELEATRMDVEWLDTKLDEGSFDCIVTHPPSESRMTDPKTIERIYKEFFHQAEWVLKKKGKIVLCVSRDGDLRKNLTRFTIEKESAVWQGMQELKVFVLVR